MKVTLHTFTMGDCDDLEIYVAQPIYEWQQTDAGKWCTEHAENMHWTAGIENYGFRIWVTGELTEQDAIFHSLKYTGIK